jgi:hypothetical protein
MLILLLGLAHSAVCADDSLAELEHTMADVLEANTNIDDIAFERSSKLMDAALTCLDVAPPRSSITRLHHTMALRAFVDGRLPEAERSLSALRHVDSRWTSPFPAGHPFTALWNDAADSDATQPIGSIAPKAWVVDGDEVLALPTERSFLLQVRDEAGAIQLSRYLSDPSTVPDFGQNRVVDPLEVPWSLSLRVLGTGRALGQGQNVDGSGALAEQQASTFAPAGSLALRLTPNARFGVEGSLSVLPADDVIASASAPVGVEGQVLGLVGTQVPQGGRSLFVRGRAGVMTDTVRAWPRAGSGVEPSAWRVWGPSLGAEAGLLSDRSQLDVALDGALAGLSPWRADLRAGGTALLTDALGLRFEGLGRLAGQPLLDGDAAAGSVWERELRLSAGVDLVF